MTYGSLGTNGWLQVDDYWEERVVEINITSRQIVGTSNGYIVVKDHGFFKAADVTMVRAYGLEIIVSLRDGSKFAILLDDRGSNKNSLLRKLRDLVEEMV